MKRERIAAALAVAAVAAVPSAADAHVAHVIGGDAISPGASSYGGVEHVTNVRADGETGGHVVIEGDRLYMGMYGLGLKIFDIGTDPASPEVLGTWRPKNDQGDGYRIAADAPPDAAVFDGRHIAVLNGTNRTSRNISDPDARTDNTYFLDTTDPAKPELLWTFEGADDGESHNGDIVDERRLWLPSGGRKVNDAKNNGLRIYDLNPLLKESPAAPDVLFRGDPVALWEKSPYRGGQPVGPAWDHTHDITVYPDFEVNGRKRDIALLVEGGAYADEFGDTGSLFVIDITDPRAPVVLERWRHDALAEALAGGQPPLIGHHQAIRYFHEAQFLDGDPRTVLVTDEDLHSQCDSGGVTALRLSEDLTSVTELSQWFIADGNPTLDAAAFGPICSVHVFSTHGNLAFFGSYNAGLQVVDYTDPAKPRYVGHNQQMGADSWGALYHEDGLVYVGDFGARGLDVFRHQGDRPDLVAEKPTIVMGKGDRPSTLTVRIRNGGAVGAPAVVVEVTNGSRVLATRTIEPLAAGEGTEFYVAWDTKHMYGEQQVKVTVDPADSDRIDEADDAVNNTSTAWFKFKGRTSGS